MNQFSLSNYHLSTKICWSLLLLLSLCALGLSVFGAIAYSPIQFVLFGVASIAALLLGQHEPRINKFRLGLSGTQILIFWAALWIGVSGAVFISLLTSLAAYQLFPKNKKRWLLAGSVNVTATYLSSTLFYLYLQKYASFTGIQVAENPVGIEHLLAGVAILAATHFFSNLILYSVFLKFETESTIGSQLQITFLNTIVSYVSGAILAIGVHFAFLIYGATFGLFVIPVLVLADIFYRIHLKSIAVKTKEISDSSRIHLATVEALATAIDARDQVGVGHVRRTQIYAVGMGEILGLSDDEIHALRTGALLHDIGKLGVPDHILNKPGRLTPAEMEKMKIHSTVGASILEKIDFSYPVVPTVKFHHEMWDGTGYPNGLKREQIPLTARILAVADAYDTLRGARPFRAAISRDEARRFLLNGSNTQFDPKLVDVFLRNLRQFENEVDADGLSYDLDDKANGSILNEDDAAHSSKGYVEHIKRANREVFELYELAKVFSASLNIQDTLSLFVKKISDLVPFDTCAVYLMDKSQTFADVRYAMGDHADYMRTRKIKLGEGATGYVLKKRQAVYNINPALDFSFNSSDTQINFKAMASLPLIANEVLIGAVSIYSTDLESYEDEHMRLLETISRIASDAISKSVYHAETENHALTDPMTNLPNARCLQIHFENEVARAKRNMTEFQVLMLDLDGFKAVNDTFGHKVGDQLLREISKVMRNQLREYDFLARYAGDEFVAVIPESSSEGILELCQRLEKSVLNFKLPVGDGKFASVGVSLGAACYPQNGESLDQVIIAADKMMYSVKAQHKQKYNTPPRDAPPPIKPIENPTRQLTMEDFGLDDDLFVVELDESHIISNALN